MNRISARERLMLGIVLGIFFVLANLAVLSSLKKKHAQISADIAARKTEVASLKSVLADRENWAKRDAWLSATQPKLANPDQAGVALLEEVKQTAKAGNVLLESPELGALESQPAYRSVAVLVQTKSSWEALIGFLNSLQQPDKFIVFESADLRIDPGDPTQMRGRFRIAKWYAP